MGDFNIADAQDMDRYMREPRSHANHNSPLSFTSPPSAPPQYGYNGRNHHSPPTTPQLRASLPDRRSIPRSIRLTIENSFHLARSTSPTPSTSASTNGNNIHIDTTIPARANRQNSPMFSYHSNYLLYNHHPGSACDSCCAVQFDALSPRLQDDSSAPTLDDFTLDDHLFSTAETTTALRRADSDHMVLHTGSQFGLQAPPPHHQTERTPLTPQSPPRQPPGPTGPALWLFFARIAAALVAFGLGAERLSRGQLTPTRSVVAVGGLAGAAMAGRKLFLGSRRGVEGTVDVVLLCMVSGVLLAVSI